MTDEHMDQPVTITLSLTQIFAVRDLIGECLDHTRKLSPAASHHSAALRAADEKLETAIREQFNDG